MFEKQFINYFAGFVDGDGCFILQIINRKRKVKNKTYNCIERIQQIAISGTQLDCLEYFKKNIGGSICITKKIEGHKTLFFYRKSICEIEFLQRLKSILIEKTHQCQFMIDFINSSPENREKIIHNLKISRKNGTFNFFDKNKIMITRNTIHPTSQDYQYLAGFIDAECSIQINKKWEGKSFRYVPILRCGNTKTPVIEWMIQRFGGNIFFQNKIKENHSNLINYHLYGKNLKTTLENVFPFLIHKKPRCQEALKLIEIIENRAFPNSKNFESWKNTFNPIKEQIYHNLKLLNSKGS